MSYDIFELDLTEEFPISMNFAVQDIRTPGKRDSSFTKTIVIPGTDRNNEFFSKVYDLGYFIQTTGTTQYEEGDFNPNLKTLADVYIDNIPQFRGYLKLDRIIRDDWDKISYECTIYGKLKSFWSEMGDKKLTELDMSAYNHTYGSQAVAASWSPVVGQGYVYPMVNWGFGTMTNTNVEWWKPGIFLKDYVDKIFSANGYQYSSAFFNTNFFKRLFIPLSSDRLRLSYSAVALSEARASRSSTQTINVTFANGNQVANTTGKVVLFNDDSTTPNSDAGSQYTPASGVFTSTNTRKYNVKTVVDFRYLFTPAGATTSRVKMQVAGRILKFDSQGNTQSYANGTSTAILDFQAEGTINPGDTTATYRLEFTADNILVKAGEKIQVQILQTNLPVGAPPFPKPMYQSGGGTLDLQIMTDSYMEVKVSDASLMSGDTVVMSDALPEDVRQADLMSSIVKTFNLYMEEDKLTPNKLIIEPFVDYYSSGVTLNWSDKLDVSNPLQIEPMATLEGRRYVLKFADDNDYLNEFYKKKYNESYGEKKIDIANDWVTDTVTIEPLFAPTPSELTVGTDRVIPAVYTMDSSGHPSNKASKLRLLYWGGLVTTNQAFTIYDSYTGVKNSFTQYPYSGHLDSVSNPDYDVNFSHPREVFWNATTYTTGNLYNEYWKQYMDELSDVNSKIVTGYFFLTPSDIHQLDFRNKIFLHGQTYRINRVIDYNPVNSALTKVELIRIKTGLKFSGRRKPSLNAGGGSLGDTNPAYSTTRLLGMNGNSNPNPSNVISGVNNFIAYNTSGCTIVGGEGNSILGDCDSVSIYNSSGCTVLGGAVNVSIYNSSGLTIAYSNISYSHNEVLPSQNDKVKYVNEEQYYMTEIDQLLVNTYSSAGVNWYLPTNITKGQEIVIKNGVDMGLNTCTLNGNGWNIDSASTLDFSEINHSYTLRFMGDKWVLI
jgi:hypothetical protein